MRQANVPTERSKVGEERPVRVLHVMGSLGRGGAEARMMEILRRIDCSRVTFDFCLLGPKEGVYAAEARRLGARVFGCPIARSRATFLGRLVQAIRQGGYDAVHSHVYQFSGVVLLAARFAGVQGRCAFVWNTSDGRAWNPARMVYRLLAHRLLDANASDVVGVSESCLDVLWGSRWRADPRLRVVHIGPDISRFDRNPRSAEERRVRVTRRGGPVLIHIGRFQPQKNHQALVPIAHEVLARWPGASFVLVGDGPLRPAIEQAVAETGLAKSFRFLGDRADVPALLTDADALMLPSLWEGLPGVALEALAAGIPVVGSRIPPIEEIARLNFGVILADAGRPKEFADAIVAAVHLGPVGLSPNLTVEAATRALAGLYSQFVPLGSRARGAGNQEVPK